MQKQTGVTEKRKWLFRLFFCCLIILSDHARIHQPDPVFFGSECFPEHCRYIAGWPSFDLVDEAVAQKENTFFLKHDATERHDSLWRIRIDPDSSVAHKRRHYHASIVEIVSVVSSSTSSNTLTVSSEVKVVTPFSMAVLRIAAPSS